MTGRDRGPVGPGRQNVRMGMRTDCRHYESRSYPNGDVVRKCRLDLAPEAPWRCPDDCPSFEARRYDAGWHYGSLGGSMEPPGEEPLVLGDDVAALLDAAEDIVNAAAPEALAEAEKARRRPSAWRRGPGVGRRRKKRR